MKKNTSLKSWNDYKKIWRKENKMLYLKRNNIYQKKFRENNKEKSKHQQIKYRRKKIICLFCKKSIFLYLRSNHFKTKFHKKNVKKFEINLKKIKKKIFKKKNI